MTASTLYGRHCEAPLPRHCEAVRPKQSKARLKGFSWSVLFLFLCVVLTPAVSSAADKLDKYDSAYVNTLNMTDAEIAELYGLDSTKLAEGPTLQEMNEENPTYVVREYDHKQQVIVGSVVMFCVALAMVLMNNYNPKR